jgi:hypothetical protein
MFMATLTVTFEETATSLASCDGVGVAEDDLDEYTEMTLVRVAVGTKDTVVVGVGVGVRDGVDVGVRVTAPDDDAARDGAS